MTRAIVTSPDGQWAAVRRDRVIALHAGGAGAVVGRLELTSDDAELAMVGPPNVLAVVTRGAERTTLTLHQPPFLEQVATLELEPAARLVAVTGTRLVLAVPGAKQVAVVRAAGRALTSQTLDLGAPLELAVGLDKNQVLFSLPRKLEVWDAVSGRPLLRPQLQLPPPPRAIGAAAGHLWATRPGSDEVYVYRLSDGRPFRHYVGAPVEDVVCNPASPVIVLVTQRGLVRLQCYAHSLLLLDAAPWEAGTVLAQLAVGEDISLIGVPIDDADGEPWRLAIGGTGAPAATTEPSDAATTTGATAADKLRALRAGGGSVESGGIATTSATARAGWRDTLVSYGNELARGIDAELPVVAVDTELGELSHRLALATPARRALLALYALHLVGEPRLAIAKLARALGDWSEPLGQGELATLGLAERADGRVALRAAVTNLLDGAPPLAIRLVGGPPTTPRAGLCRVTRDGRSDAAIETSLASQLGRIAVIEGELASAIVEARICGATALALDPPAGKPMPWPAGGGLVVVADGDLPRWLASAATL